MTSSLPDLPPLGYRGLALAALRVVASFTLLVAAYFLLPLDWLADVPALVSLPIGLALFAVLLVYEVVAIVRAPYPGIQALEALGVLVPLFLLTFAATYYVMGAKNAAWFSEDLSRLDALYFTMTTFATVGFGDITPVAAEARVVVVVQMFLDLIALGAGIRVIVGAVRKGRARVQRPAEGLDG